MGMRIVYPSPAVMGPPLLAATLPASRNSASYLNMSLSITILDRH